MTSRPHESGTVAHYTRLEHLANVLADGHLRMGPVGELQDQREASMSWIETVGIGLEPHYASIKVARRIKSGAAKRILLLCAAGEREVEKGSDWVEESPYGRPRMWSQYGDSSRGFCVVLDRDKLKAELQRAAVRPEHAMSGKVEYYSWLHAVSGGITIETGPEIRLDEGDSFGILNDNEMIRSVYFKKSKDWIAESEYRYLLYSHTAEPVFLRIENSIKYVVLGTRFPNNQVSQAKSYCAELKCDLYWLTYGHPRYNIHQLQQI